MGRAGPGLTRRLFLGRKPQDLLTWASMGKSSKSSTMASFSSSTTDSSFFGSSGRTSGTVLLQQTPNTYDDILNQIFSCFSFLHLSSPSGLVAACVKETHHPGLRGWKIIDLEMRITALDLLAFTRPRSILVTLERIEKQNKQNVD